MAITSRGLAAIKPGKWLTAGGVKGAGRLAAYGMKSGGATFYFRYTTPAGIRDSLPLGQYDEKGRKGLSLQHASTLAAELSKRFQSGERDLRAILAAETRDAERKRKAADAAVAAEAAQAVATLGALMAAYVKHLKDSSKPSWKEVEASVKRNLLDPFPDIAAIAAERMTVDDLMPVFHRLTRAKSWRAAEKLRAHLRAAYRAAKAARNDAGAFAFEGFVITGNPIEDLDVTRPKEAAAKAAEAAKERKWALSEAELRAYWKRLVAMETPQGALMRFHLLTGGQRMEQLSRLQVSDYDADLKTITLRDTKGRRRVAYEHVVPLLPDAIKAMKAMRPKPDADFPHLFSVSGGLNPAVPHTLADAMHELSVTMIKAKELSRAITPGAIRRTVETRLAAKKVTDEVLARLLSHGLGSVQARNYNAHHYDDEKRSALLKLRSLLDPRQGKVIKFPGAHARTASGSRR